MCRPLNARFYCLRMQSHKRDRSGMEGGEGSKTWVGREWGIYISVRWQRRECRSLPHKKPATPARDWGKKRPLHDRGKQGCASGSARAYPKWCKGQEQAKSGLRDVGRLDLLTRSCWNRIPKQRPLGQTLQDMRLARSGLFDGSFKLDTRSCTDV